MSKINIKNILLLHHTYVLNTSDQILSDVLGIFKTKNYWNYWNSKYLKQIASNFWALTVNIEYKTH